MSTISVSSNLKTSSNDLPLTNRLLLVGEFSTEFVFPVLEWLIDVTVVVPVVAAVVAGVVAEGVAVDDVVPFRTAGELGFEVVLLFFRFLECLRHEFRSKCCRRNAVSASSTTLFVGDVLPITCSLSTFSYKWSSNFLSRGLLGLDTCLACPF